MTITTRPDCQAIDFYQLSPAHQPKLWRTLADIHPLDNLDGAWLSEKRRTWQQLQAQHPDDDAHLSAWLMDVFNTAFAHHHTILARNADIGKVDNAHEPEYFPAADGRPARIVFAHGYFASALHEISHWCIAGKARRLLNDFGYWYAHDGRNQSQQRAFEQVEIQPQALECLFTLACRRNFRVSQDNLNADFDTQDSTFAQDVAARAHAYLKIPHTLPPDAQRLLAILRYLCQDSAN